MKEELIEHFNFLSNMDIKEYILYRTWYQIKNKKWNINDLKELSYVKNNIWIPDNKDDYLNIKPRVVIPKNKKEHLQWTLLRYFISSAPTYSTPGRGIRIIVIDENSNKFLGVLELVSDFAMLKPRDVYIGWNKQIKEENKMLNYIAMGSTIVPTQPLGYNYVGGKLMTLCLCSNEVENEWNKRYKEPLLGITTTSLYGGFSQYNGLKYWKKCGTTTGEIRMEPNDEINLRLRHWMRDNYPDEFEIAKHASRMKTRISYFCYSRMGVKPPINNAKRGVYFCSLYENTRDFLNKSNMSFGSKKFNNSIDNLTNLWKENYAKKRLENLEKTERYNKKVVFYDDLIKLSWKETKMKYIEKLDLNEKEDVINVFFK